MRKLLYGLAGLLALLIVAAVIGPNLVDWNNFKGEIAARAKEATGRDIHIGGNIDLGLIPSPRLAARDIRVSNIPGAAVPDMVRVAQMAVEVRLIPLLSGKVEVAGIRLVNPVIEFERLPDGKVNWAMNKPAPSGAPPSPQGGGRQEPADQQAFRLDSLRIENGSVVYRDRGQVVERIDRLSAELAAESLAGPFRIKGGLAARGVPLTVDASVGELGAVTPAPVRLALGIPDRGAEVRLTGSMTQANDGPRVEGKLQIKADDLRRFASGSGPRGAAPLPVEGQGQIDASAAAVSVKDLDIRFGDTAATGSATAKLGDKTEADVVLKIARVNLDTLLAEPDGRAPPASGPAGQAPAPAGLPGASGAAKPDDAFALPADVKASLDVAIDAVTYKGGTIRDTRLAALLDKGEIDIKRASAALPGGGRFSVNGRVKAVAGKPSFDGRVDAGADNLRVLVGWLGGNVDDIPPDRLRVLRVVSRVVGDPDQVQLLDLDVVLDASRITGGVTYALRARPAFGASIAIDQFNADAYMPVAAAQPDPRTAAQPSGRPAPPNQPAPAPEKGGLAALGDFDANVAFRVGTLTYHQTAVQGVALDATLFNGRLAIREARARNIAGTSVSLKGEAAGFSGIPTFKGTIEGESRDLTGVLRLAGVVASNTGRAIGPVKLSGQADAAQDRVKLDAKLELAGLAATLGANLTGLNAKPSLDVELVAAHSELAQLASAFGLAGSPLRGNGRLNAKVRGTLDAVDLDTKFEAAGASFAAAGKITDPTGRGAADVSLALNHPDFAQFMRIVDPEYQSGEAKPGALEVKAAVKGDNSAYNISGLRLAVGQMAIGGDATLALAGARPRLTASVDGGHLDLNRLLPPKPQARTASTTPAAAPGPGGGGLSSGSPFSRDPIDLSALGDADADVKFASRSLTYRNFRIEEPRVTLALADRVLKVNEMIGRMFDGGIDVKAEVDGRAAPKVQAAIKIDRANVAKALFEAADVDLAKGTLAFDMNVTGAGKSSQDIASSLNGAARLSVTDGSVKGFNLRAASDRLKNIDRPADLLGLLQPAMGGGETQFSSLAGTFAIDKGVIRTDDTKLAADAGAGDVKGTVDLGRWYMDMMGWFRLTEHPNSPPFGMRMVGPPDTAQRIFDTNDLQRFLVSRVGSNLLRRALPQERQQAPAAQQQPQSQSQQQQPQQQQQQQQEQQQRAKPEDILKDLLRGLRRPQQ